MAIASKKKEFLEILYQDLPKRILQNFYEIIDLLLDRLSKDNDLFYYYYYYYLYILYIYLHTILRYIYFFSNK